MSGLRHELLIAGGIIVLDQASKVAVRSAFALHESVTVIPSFFNLTRVHNSGAAFGFMNTAEFPFKEVALIVVAAVALVGLAIYGATLPADQCLARVGLAFIVGGAAGNLIDRVAFGYVLDFIDFYWRGWHFWAFNVADTAITCGVSLTILDLLGVGRHRVSRTV